MWIERIRLERFVVFDVKEFNFSKGFNLILAPNESGKSTLFRAITVLLYSSAFSSSKKLHSLKKWGSGRMFRLEGVVHIGEKAYLLVKDFEERSQEVFEHPSGRSIAKGKVVDEFLREKFPLPDEELFLKLCGVRHEELENVSVRSETMAEKIERILGGGWGENTPDEVEKALKRYRDYLKRGIDRPAKEENWGPIKRLSVEVQELEQRLQMARESAKKERDYREELFKLEESIESLTEEIEATSERLDRSRELEDLEKHREQVEENGRKIHETIMRLNKLKEELSRCEKEGEEFPEELKNLEMGDLITRGQLLGRERELRQQVKELEMLKSKGKPIIWLVLSAVASVAGIVSALTVSSLFWILVAFGLAGLVFSFFLRYRPLELEKDLKGKLEELERLVEERSSWSSGASIEKADRLIDDVRRWRSDYDKCLARLDEYVRGGTDNIDHLLEKIGQEFSKNALEAEGLKGRIEKLGLFRLEPDEMVKIEKGLEKNRESLKSLEEKKRRIEMELSAIEKIDLVEISEELELKKKRLEELGRKLRTVEAALEALDEARRGFAGYLASELPASASSYLEKITNGKYNAIEIDPVTLDVGVPVYLHEDENGKVQRAVEPGLLSQGARDQVYLAVRLGLVKLLGKQEVLPLMLDDPLVHFDPARRQRAMDILEKLAKEHQVLFFSCDLERRFPDVHRVTV